MTVEELKVKLSLETKDLTKETSQVKNQLNGITSEAQKVKRKIGGLFSIGGTQNVSREYRTLETQIKRTTKVIEDLKNKQASLGDKGRVPTETYSALQSQLVELESEFDKLLSQQESWLNAGVDPSTAGFQALDAQLTAVGDKMHAIEGEMKDLESSGKAFTPSSKFQELQGKITAAKEELKQYLNEQAMLGEGPSGGSRNLGAKIKGIGAHFQNLGRNASRAGMGFKKFIRAALGIGSLMMLFRRVRSAFTEGFSNLSQYSNRTRQDLAMLKGSLTQVKNSLAVAFAPIITAIAPYVQTLVNLITTACNALAQFFGALTGQKSVTVAKSGLGDISASASGAADATNAANSAAQEYQKTLMGFDQINKLDDNSSSGSGGGGGGSAGGVGGAGGFTTTQIANVYSGWADAVKEAWKNADFTDIGSALAEKLNNALANIPWDKIRETCNRIAKSVGTFINGFVKDFDWGQLARTISYAIETAMDTVATLIQTIDWAEIGRAVVNFIVGIDWGGLFKSAFNLAGSIVGGIASFIAGAVEEAFSHVKDYFTGKIEEAGGNIVLGLWNGIKDAIGNAYNWIKENIFKPFIDGFKRAFGIASPSKEMKPLGQEILMGVLEGVKSKLSDLLEWFKDLPGKIKAKVGEIFVNVTAKLTSWKDALKDKAVDFKARLIDKFKGSSFSSTIENMKARLVDKIKSSKFSNTIENMKARLVDKIKSSKFGSVIGGMIANLTGKKDSLTSKDKTMSMTANITKVKWSAGNKIIVPGGMTLDTKAGGGIFVNGRWKPVTAAANGGSFANGQMFVARESGPELVGRIGGSTAVMNNDQIVSSVANGVARAVASVMANGTPVSVTLEGDAKGLFRVVRTEARNYTNATGLAAFPV